MNLETRNEQEEQGFEIVLTRLRKAYGPKVLFDVPQIEFPPGSITSLMGDNGVGKTTLLNIIAGLDRRYEGTLTFNRKVRTAEVQKHIVMVRQRPYLFRWSVFDNIAYPLRVRGVERRARRTAVHTLLRDFGIEAIAQRKAHTLSGGEAQKVALARALAAGPQLLLLDETTASIHESALLTMEHQVREFHRRTGCTVIFVTHNQEQAARLCERSVVLGAGGI